MLEQISWAATAVGVIIAVFTLRASNSQRRRQFETIYVQRYWSLLDELSVDAQVGCERPDVSDTDQRAIRSYLRLCEDELELRREGWITGETWAIWQTGITAQLERWPFNAIWHNVDLQTGPRRPHTAVPEEFVLLREFLSTKRDPLKTHPWRKRTWRSFRRAVTGGP